MTADPRHPRACAAAVCLAGALLAAQGCGHFGILVKKKDSGKDDAATQPVDSSLSALASDPRPVEPGTLEGASPGPGEARPSMDVEESARLLEQYLQGLNETPALTGDPLDDPQSSTPIASSETPITDPQRENSETQGATDDTDDPMRFSLAQIAGDRESGPETPETLGNGDDQEAPETLDPETIGPETGDAPEPVIVDPEIRKAELVAELKELLASTTRRGSEPAPSAIALAALDAIGSGTLESLYEEGVLSSAEMTTLSAARDVLRSIASSGAIASPGEIADVLDRVRRELDASAGMRVTKALLCTRVDGFGRYEEFASNEFLAGTNHPVIVYTEVDRFAHREVLGESSEPRYDVDMSQRLELYHVADDVNTWNRAAERVSERSRNKVRDFYLTNAIVLPRTLRAGRYHLKVVMRDLAGESVAERVIPLRIVAR